jgi:CDP-diacylglycerol--serine O-phosphatidyltransferase
MKIKLFTLPNLLTLCNLACGCAAVVSALDRQMVTVFWLVCAAAVFDLMDGAMARLLGQHSAIGRELDSLADVVSFGVAPSMALYPLWYGTADTFPVWLGYATFAVALFSALRLAKFNVDPDQSEEFTGLPTPACALAITSLVAVWDVPRQWMILVLVVAASALLVSPIRLFSLKFKTPGWRENRLRYLFLASSAVLVALLGIGGVTASVGLYVLLGALRHVAGMRPGSAE